MMGWSKLKRILVAVASLGFSDSNGWEPKQKRRRAAPAFKVGTVGGHVWDALVIHGPCSSHKLAREIGHGITPSSVAGHLCALERDGMVVRLPKKRDRGTKRSRWQWRAEIRTVAVPAQADLPLAVAK